MAVAALVIIATIMAFSLQMTTKTAKRVVDVYVKNQAELYAKNAAEYALFEIANSATRCNPTSIGPFTLDGIYNVSVSISYAYSNPPAGCVGYVTLQAAPDSSREYAYAKLDVTVSAVPGTVTTEPVRIFRRYIEEIDPF